MYNEVFQARQTFSLAGMTRLYNYMDGRMKPRAQNFILPYFLSRDKYFFFSLSELSKILVGMLD